ncbi:MAG: hypothetical protein ACRDDZ_05515 [Marinifilaceae bacterium]
MQQYFQMIEALLKEYLKDEIEVGKIYLFKKLAMVLAFTCLVLFSLFCVILLFVFIAVLITIGIGVLTDSYAIGALIGFLSFLIFYLLCYFNRHALLSHFTRSMFRNMMEYRERKKEI